jgi:glutathione S-transferase
MAGASELKLYYHPLSSYCWKVLIALYENATPFAPALVDLQDEKQRADFHALWPIGKFPVLRDEARDWMVPESSIIIEYLAQHHPGRVDLVSRDPDIARQIRMRDRFFDLYIHQNMQKIVADHMRPEGQKDLVGVEQAKSQIRTAYEMIESEFGARKWAMGDAFTMADCSAAPALFYASKVVPRGAAQKNVAAYLERLKNRPSFARVLKEAEPYFHMFPIKD